MTEQARVSVHAAIEQALMKLLDRLAPSALNAQAAVFRGTGADALELARVARAAATTGNTQAQEQQTIDWPLSADGAPVGFLRFTATAGSQHSGGDRSLGETAAGLGDDARVKSIVASLADLVVLADYLRDSDSARRAA